MGQRTVIALWLAILVAGCGETATPSAQPVASASTPEALVPTTPKPSPTAKPTTKPTPKPTLRPTQAPVPPKPSGVAFHEHAGPEDEDEFVTIRQSVTWKAPRTKGVEIRVYGVTKCLAAPDPLPTKPSWGPCLVKGTKLPASVRTLLAKAPASDGVARWHWREQTGCNIGLEFDSAGPVIHAIVLAAYNESGNSIFAIAEPGGWQVYDPNDIIC